MSELTMARCGQPDRMSHCKQIVMCQSRPNIRLDRYAVVGLSKQSLAIESGRKNKIELSKRLVSKR